MFSQTTSSKRKPGEFTQGKDPSRLDLPEDEEERMQLFLSRTDDAMARREGAQARIGIATAGLIELGFSAAELEELLADMVDGATATGAGSNAKAAETAKGTVSTGGSKESLLEPATKPSRRDEEKPKSEGAPTSYASAALKPRPAAAPTKVATEQEAKAKGPRSIATPKPRLPHRPAGQSARMACLDFWIKGKCSRPDTCPFTHNWQDEIVKSRKFISAYQAGTVSAEAVKKVNDLENRMKMAEDASNAPEQRVFIGTKSSLSADKKQPEAKAKDEMDTTGP